MKTARKRLTCVLLCMCISASFSALAQSQGVSFTCQADSPGSPVVGYFVRNGRLYSDMPTESGSPPDYGPVQVSETLIVATKSQPMMKNGTGRADTQLRVNPSTGSFEFEVNATHPRMPPFHSLSKGSCHSFSGVGATGANSSGVSNHGQDNYHGQGSEHNHDSQRAQREEDQAREDAEDARKQKELDDRIAREKAAADAENARKEEQARAARAKEEAERKAMNERIAAERNLRNSFRGHATTCPGGGKDVFYLQTSTPPKTGCSVRFQAHCALSLNTMVFVDQANYVGGSCMGVGDIIKLGEMPCKAEDVQIEMVSATCGQ